MSQPLRRLPSLVEQTASYLREGFQQGRWVGQLPGVVPLASDLMVSKGTLRAALKVLEEEGWIENGGRGRRKKIVRPRDATSTRRTLRIGIMHYEPLEDDEGDGTKIMVGVRRAIENSGHTCIFSGRSLRELNDNLSRLPRLVKAAEADAWIVFAASRVVLEWFAAQPFPVYAYGGRFHNLPVACSATLIAPAIESAVNTLVALGHRRIVMLAPSVLRKPTPIPSLVRYLALLEERGITPSDYHLPHFEETVEGLEKCLDALFRVTPPTALLVEQPSNAAALFFFLARRGLRVPQDVSVVSMSLGPVFRMCLPAPDHFQMQINEHLARISRWVNGVAKGRPHRRQEILDAVYVPGGTVGPAKP